MTLTTNEPTCKLCNDTGVVCKACGKPPVAHPGSCCSSEAFGDHKYKPCACRSLVGDDTTLLVTVKLSIKAHEDSSDVLERAKTTLIYGACLDKRVQHASITRYEVHNASGGPGVRPPEGDPHD